nr:MerR family transcriptional regulator [Planosporangium mesophilum]
MLTIGAFARACRLSPKALRLYDELGLLPPAHVDPASGYRYYEPGQLERARLVAWLRRLGMPLARIRVVCDLHDRDAGAAADEIAGYWARVVADTETRQRLAAFLVDYLSGKGTTMADTPTTLGIRYAARSDTGKVRPSNQDAVYAGTRLLAVADGFGASSGDRASAAAIDALKPLEAGIPAGDLLNALQEAVADADRALHGIASSAPDGVGTTLTAMVWAGSQLALVHIGDTRAYLLRGGELFQISHDHSYVQSLVDSGSLTPEEAASHPQRAMLIRALDGKGSPRPDLSLHDAQAGDRYVLCSDGLSAVVAADAIRTALTMITDPEQAVGQLIDLAYQSGAPDNIACVVADVVPL